MARTPNALPGLDAPYRLGGDARRDFERDGHVLLRHVAAPAEVAAYRSLIREATFGNTAETRALAEPDTYGKAFIQVFLGLRPGDAAASDVTPIVYSAGKAW